MKDLIKLRCRWIRYRTPLLLTLLFTLASATSRAEAPTGLMDRLESVFSYETLKSDALSPIYTDAKYATALGASTTAVTLILRKEINDPVNESMNRDRPLGSWSRFGDVSGQLMPNVTYCLAMIGMSYFDSEEKHLRRAELMFRSTIHASLVALALKLSVREGRPYDSDERTAFPSGHTTTTFAFASAVAMEHEWYYGLAAYGLATFVGLSRINDHQHYLHDVLAGATIGISYGIGVHNNMNQKTHETLSPVSFWRAPPLILVLPTNDLRGSSISITQRF